jgi:uncharacterized protein (DUF3084 family)
VEREIIIAVIVAVVTGGVSAFGTVAALKVHITYLREHVARLDATTARAHVRIDGIERRQHPHTHNEAN